MDLKPLTSTLRLASFGLMLGMLGIVGIGIGFVLILLGIADPLNRVEEMLFQATTVIILVGTLGASILGFMSVVCELINRHANDEMRKHPHWVTNAENEASLHADHMIPVVAMFSLNLLCIIPCVLIITRFFVE